MDNVIFKKMREASLHELMQIIKDLSYNKTDMECILQIIDKEIEMSSEQHMVQDYLVYKAFILPYCNKIAGEFYQRAYRIDFQRFVLKYTSDKKGKEMLFFIIAHGIAEDLEIIANEVALGMLVVDINSISDIGWTPLFFAVQREDNACVSYLLKMGADPLFKCECDLNPLLAAIQLGNECMVSNMIQYLYDKNNI